MSKEDLVKEARTLSDSDLRQSLEWNKNLAEHYDEIGEYHPQVQEKIDVMRDELRRRMS